MPTCSLSVVSFNPDLGSPAEKQMEQASPVFRSRPATWLHAGVTYVLRFLVSSNLHAAASEVFDAVFEGWISQGFTGFLRGGFQLLRTWVGIGVYILGKLPEPHPARRAGCRAPDSDVATSGATVGATTAGTKTLRKPVHGLVSEFI